MIYIPREMLEPHPDNPRKTLGDLSELAASIRKQGLLQNLTVVPSPNDPDKYRIVIGHRRFAASGIAGLNELPCIIDEKMTYAEQLAVMMSENIQRNDLTIAEKAGGVQMMMDLGMDVREISSNTGISDTTVRRYAKLSQLDRGGVRAAEQRGATLAQLCDIYEIEDEDMRDEALEAAGTADYNRVMQRVRRARNREKRLPLMTGKLDAFAARVQKQDYDRHSEVGCWWYSDDNVLDRIEVFKPVSGKTYEYVVDDFNVTLYEVRLPKDDSKEREKRAAAEKIQQRAYHERELVKQFGELRTEWVRTASFRGREDAARCFVLWVLTRSEYQPGATIGQLYQREYLSKREVQPKQTTGSIRVSTEEVLAVPEKELLRSLVLVAYDRVSQSEMTLLDRYSGKPKEESHTEVRKIRGLYAMLENMGYLVSADERAWLDGTHECYTFPHEEEPV